MDCSAMLLLLLVLVSTAWCGEFTSLNQTDVYRVHPMFPTISRHDIIRGLSPYGYRGDMKKLHAVLKKAVLKKSLNIIVLGGSLPLGAGLEPHTYRDCWPSQLKLFLRIMLKIEVHVNNLAIRAVSSDAQATFRFNHIMAHLTSDIDLILVDISLNDKPHNDPQFKEHVAYFEGNAISDNAKQASLMKERKKQGEGRSLMQLLLHFMPSTTALMYFETFVGGGKTNPVIHSYEDLKRAWEKGLTDGVYDFIESPAEFECYPDVGRYYHFQALVEYKIPIISYPDIVCPIKNFSFWGPNMHHPKEYHRFTAYLLAMSIFEIADADFSEIYYSTGSYPPSQLKKWNDYIYDNTTSIKLKLDSKLIVCVITPLSYMAVNRPLRFKPLRKGKMWRYYMDVVDKPGWIIDAIPNFSSSQAVVPFNKSREIVFPITLSTVDPMLRLSFLRSYNSSMGKLSCCIGGDKHKFHCEIDDEFHIFDGRWSDLTSQGVAQTVHLRLQSNITNNRNNPKKTTQKNVICHADSGKFKIIGIIGC